MPHVYRYPYNSITEKTDYLQITIKEHSRFRTTQNPVDSLTTLSGGGEFDAVDNVGGTGSSIGVAKIGDVIILPMPSNISDNNAVGYGEDSLDVLGEAAGKVAMNVMKSGANITKDTGIAGAIKKIGEDVTSGLKKGGVVEAALDAFTRTQAASAAGIIGANVTANQLLTRSTGQILNPNMELLFSGPTLRTFQFQFKLTPREAQESYQIKSIIRSFKKNMAPQTGESDAYLRTPRVFELRYRKGNTNHPFLNRFKQCALTNMSVNYTGEGVYATYSDATPVSMVMTLDFKELVPIYFDDYADVDGPDLIYNPAGGTYSVGY